MSPRLLRNFACSCVVAVFADIQADPTPPVPAFPGAEGFGALSAGGRGGRVLEVTTLDDSGPGSLRAAVEAEGARLVVFRVAGTIELRSELEITHPFITIAGQSAPGGGITLKTHPENHRSALTIARGCHDVIIRYLRSRPGPHVRFSKPSPRGEVDTSEVKDAIQILGARRVILDHCSASWATDEVVSTFYDAQDVTIQWCIISEALVKSHPSQQLPGKGLLIGSRGGERISVHHNLLAHNVGRNPLVKAAGVVDVVNNVVVAPQAVAMAIDAEVGQVPTNFVGNLVALPHYERYRRLGSSAPPGLLVARPGQYSIFLEDNFAGAKLNDFTPRNPAEFIGTNNSGRTHIVSVRHPAPPITTTPPPALLQLVLENAGAIRPARDTVDVRIVEDARAHRVRLINRPEEVGGWPELATAAPPADSDHDAMPDAWEKSHGLNPRDATDGRADADGDGYTNVEEFLNETNPRGARN